MEFTQITAMIKSLLTGDGLEKIVEGLTEQKAIEIITGINKGEKYWWQEKKRMQMPQPNMGPRRPVTYSSYNSDEFGKEKLFEPFIVFLLKTVTIFPHLTLYVHDGEFGFAPVFGIRFLNQKLQNPYLIKFEKHHFPKKSMYEEMVRILYSRKNKAKHNQFRLEKIRSLESYEY